MESLTIQMDDALAQLIRKKSPLSPLQPHVLVLAL